MDVIHRANTIRLIQRGKFADRPTCRFELLGNRSVRVEPKAAPTINVNPERADGPQYFPRVLALRCNNVRSAHRPVEARLSDRFHRPRQLLGRSGSVDESEEHTS